MRGSLLGAALFLLLAAPAWAGGPFMLVGAAENGAEAANMALAKAAMERAQTAGLTTIRMTETWSRGERKLPADDRVKLSNAIGAATFSDVRVILSIYPYGSSQTPLTQEQQADFAAFAADVAEAFPTVHDFIVGNEPNLNRFWLPQFGPNGEDLAAQSYESLLAATYDAIKAVRPHSTIYGGAVSPRGGDNPEGSRPTHSPTAFITDLGAAYRASGRQVPIMDAFAFHPYPEYSSLGPNFPHPRSTSIGLADYDKLVGLLGQAFDGTAQRGSGLPILYDEFGIETQIPPAEADLYTGAEPRTTHPVDEATQAKYYRQAMAMTYCNKTVMGILLFHVVDEAPLDRWQSGVYYADDTPKSSLPAVRAAADAVHRNEIASCPGLELTPKITLKTLPPQDGSTRVSLTCDLDCRYTAQLDGGRKLRGTATGGVATTLVFPVAPQPGKHRVDAWSLATLNAGPVGHRALTFTS
ncbi:MAG TPA: hypothetical protein VF186_03845 [Gaiellaceae bacterium]